MSCAESVTSIQSMDRCHLAEAWTKQFGKPPPKHVSVTLMRMMLSWEAQAAIEGGLTPQVFRALRGRARQLQKAAQFASGGVAAQHGGKPPREQQEPKQKLLLRPGIQLMREWNGRTYCVEVADDGFIMDGKQYRSLTAIAKRITGAHWSGPRFFGLVERKGSAV